MFILCNNNTFLRPEPVFIKCLIITSRKWAKSQARPKTLTQSRVDLRVIDVISARRRIPPVGESMTSAA